MPSYAFDIHGDVPSKKNSRRAVQVGRMRFTVPGKYHDAWYRDAAAEMMIHRFKGAPFKKASVIITLYPSTARRSDISNKIESIMDLLVSCGVLEDDNWYVVPELIGRFGGVDKLNPRASVILTV